MKQTIITLSIGLLPIMSIAQSDMAYLDTYLEVCKKRQAAYVKKLIKEVDGGYLARIETMDGRTKVEGVYQDRPLTIENGVFTYYYDNGKVESTGTYTLGQKSGVWKRFDQAGNEKAEKVYDIEAIDDLPLAVVSDPPVFNPEYVSLDEYLSRTLNTGGKRLRGTIKVEFVVERNGSVSNIYLLEGLNETADVRITNALMNMPRWTPGKQHGATVRVARQATIKL